MVGVTNLFKNTENNQYIFYPYTFLGKGFLVYEKDKIKIEEILNIYLAFITLLILFKFAVSNGIYVFGLPVPYTFFLGIISRTLISRLTVLKCQESNINISIKEYFEILFVNEKPERHVINLIGSFILLYFSIYILLKFEISIVNLLIGLLSIFFYKIIIVESIILIKKTYFPSE